MALTRSHASNILDSDLKSSCRVTTTSNITLSGSAPNTYDGITLVANDRILVQGQTDGTQNGIYFVSILGTGSNGTWTRATDAQYAYSLSPGVVIYIEEGTANGNRFYVINTPGNIVIGTTSITFTSFNGPRGGNTMLQFNDATTLAGATYWSYNKTSGNLYSNSTTASTTSTTGALVVTGGVGIGGVVNLASDLNVGGNLVVSGTTTTVNSSTVSVNDVNIVLANNSPSSTLSDGAGITVNGPSPAATILYTHATTSWNLNKAVIAPSYTTLSGGQYTGYFTGPIGANTANTAVFTTVSTGNVSITGNNWLITNNINTTTGTNANLFIDPDGSGDAVFSPQTEVFILSPVTSNSTSTGALVVTGGVGIAGNAYVGNLVTSSGIFWSNGFASTISYTASTSSPTVQRLGDQWYDTSSDILYTRVNDGSSSFWLDISSVPNSFSNLVATQANIATLNVTGNLNFTNVYAYVTVAGNITAGNIVAPGGGLFANNYYYSNGIPFTGGAASVPGGSNGSGLLQFGDTGFIFGGTTYFKYDKTTGNIVGNGTNISTSATTGAIVLAGGMGIGGNLNVSGLINGALNGTVGATTKNTGYFTNLSSTDATAGNNSLQVFQVLNGSSTMGMGAQMGSGSYNSLTVSGDSVFTFTSGAVGNGNLTIAPWASATSGIRIASAANVATITLAGNVSSSAGIYAATTFYRAGTRLPIFTTASSAPTGNVVGDFWYKSGSDILYQYVNDSSNSFWLDLTTKPSQYANISITSNLYVAGTVSSSIIPGSNNTYNLGNASFVWGTVYGTTFSGTATTAKYADLAENYLSDEPLDPGDVVIFGGRKEIRSSERYADPRIAGVISTNPAYLMNSELDDSYPVALTGRVPCKVVGPVRKGDVLTSSNIIGVAQALNRSDFEPGCVLGKSLENHNENTVKTIEIVVGRF